jgi:hypothetical protein
VTQLEVAVKGFGLLSGRRGLRHSPSSAKGRCSRRGESRQTGFAILETQVFRETVCAKSHAVSRAFTGVPADFETLHGLAGDEAIVEIGAERQNRGKTESDRAERKWIVRIQLNEPRAWKQGMAIRKCDACRSWKIKQKGRLNVQEMSNNEYDRFPERLKKQ